MKEIELSAYDRYVSERHETDAAEHRHELVKKILEKLPESDRTVITLHYLGEMTAREIGNLLGVSVHTITSRLQRARKRLQEDEELMVQEVFSGVQVPASLSQNVMRRVADIKSDPTSRNETSVSVGGFRGSCDIGCVAPGYKRPISQAFPKTL